MTDKKEELLKEMGRDKEVLLRFVEAKRVEKSELYVLAKYSRDQIVNMGLNESKQEVQAILTSRARTILGQADDGIERHSFDVNYPLAEESFTLENYNDRPKPCPGKKCAGVVYPTGNANVGKCHLCRKEVSWSHWEK